MIYISLNYEIENNYFEMTQSLILSLKKNKTIIGSSTTAATTDLVHNNELWGLQIGLDHSEVRAYSEDI